MGGTGTSFIGGVGYDQTLIEKMQTANGNIPVTTTVTSVIAALKASGVKKISVATPYIEEQSLIFVKFLEESGFQVVRAKWLEQTVPNSELSREKVYRLACEVDDPDSEAIFISCIAYCRIHGLSRARCGKAGNNQQSSNDMERSSPRRYSR
ncbi:MAG: hypothetical protein AB7F96_22410 [Beijerinckiaceae bacterium]